MTILDVEMLEAAARGEHVSKAGTRSVVVINLADYDDNGDLIVNETKTKA